jgi:hypothetical protein
MPLLRDGSSPGVAENLRKGDPFERGLMKGVSRRQLVRRLRRLNRSLAPLVGNPTRAKKHFLRDARQKTSVI